MTKQILDVIVYDGQRHRPLSISGKGLPHPRDFGLEPFAISSACWRGFYCQYTIREDRLRLTHLVTRHTGEQYPIIDGIKALHEEDRLLHENENEPQELVGRWVETVWIEDGDTEISGWGVVHDGGIYAGLNVPAPLTGGILLGIGEVEVPHLQQYELKYLISSNTILELLFENGALVKTVDHSMAVAAKRQEVLSLQLPKYRVAKFEADSEAWIRATLTLDYKFLDLAWLREIYS